jgi:hypothetical protein
MAGDAWMIVPAALLNTASVAHSLGSSHIVTLMLVKNSSDRLSRMARRPQSGTCILLLWCRRKTLWLEPRQRGM